MVYEDLSVDAVGCGCCYVRTVNSTTEHSEVMEAVDCHLRSLELFF